MPTAVERLAGELLLRHWDGLLPVDVRAIAEARGHEVILRGDMDVSGEVCRTAQGGYRIICNAQDSPVRRRFTIAHELGHIELGHLRDAERCLRDPRRHYTIDNFDPRERDANRFAVGLLMPEQAVRAAAGRVKDPSVERLARLFGVSRMAMGLRLKQLGIIPAWIPI